MDITTDHDKGQGMRELEMTRGSQYRPELDLAGIPWRMRPLPIHRGYPVPWFVSFGDDGVPEFRAADAKKWRRAIDESLCWVCGIRLGHHRVFVIGPMCGINRTTSEPPCHADCAEWSAMHCPFLSRPHAVRRDATDLLTTGDATEAPGCPLLRNPGVTLLWWTQKYKVFKAQSVPDPRANPGWLIELGEPDRVRWFFEGRAAMRAEVVASIESGLPALRDAADRELTWWRREEAHQEIDSRLLSFSALYPDD